VLLEGKRALIMGVANKRSIAWGIAAAFHREGAELAFSYQSERLKENLDELLDGVSGRDRFLTFPCDVQSDEQVTAAFGTLAERWGRLDALAHCIAFADREVARHAAPLMTNGGSIFTLTYNAVERVVPGYNVMAVAKAALETEVRYLASELGPQQIRVNAISAGPLKTLAGSAVKGISKLRDLTEETAPLRRNITQEDVGDVAVFLASDLSRAVTGNTIFVDSGFHIMGVPSLPGGSA